MPRGKAPADQREEFGGYLVNARDPQGVGDSKKWLWDCLFRGDGCLGTHRVARSNATLKRRGGTQGYPTRSCGCMYRKEDLTGKKVGRLTVVRENSVRSSQGSAQWDCVCACGTEVVVVAGNLRNESTKSCGCLKREKTSERRKIDLTGRKFDRLVVIRENPVRSNIGHVRWDCLCACGTEVTVSAHHLQGGKTLSCGCLRRERSSEKFSVLHSMACKTCGKTYAGNYASVYCSKACVPHWRLTEKERREVTAALREQDGDCCGICGLEIDFTLTPKDNSRLGNEIDHIVPRFRETSLMWEFSNYQNSHSLCNNFKKIRLQSEITEAELDDLRIRILLRYAA